MIKYLCFLFLVDYPINSSQNAETKYEGDGGIKAGFIDRLILGINKKNVKLAFEDKDSSILINRNILNRAHEVMPYFICHYNRVCSIC
mgnify:CR=1 FL=1